MQTSNEKVEAPYIDPNRARSLLTLKLWVFLFIVLFINIDKSFSEIEYKKELILSASVLFLIYLLYTQKIRKSKFKNEDLMKTNSLWKGFAISPLKLSILLVIGIVAILYFINPDYPIGQYADRFVPMLVGVYFISEKPISKRHTLKYATYELTLGSILIFIGATSLMFGM